MEKSTRSSTSPTSSKHAITSTDGDLLVKQFVRSLKGNAFDWYVDLEPKSVDSWNEMEREFLNRFYSTQRTVSMIELTNARQWKDEPMVDYINRWRSLSLNCKDKLSEASAIKMCIQDMELSIVNHKTAFPIGDQTKDKKDLKRSEKFTKPNTKESMAIKTTPIKISSNDREKLEKPEDQHRNCWSPAAPPYPSQTKTYCLDPNRTTDRSSFWGLYKNRVNRIFINGASAVNIMPKSTMKKLGITSEDLSRRPWLHENGVVPSTLHQCFKYIKNGEIVNIDVDMKPFTEAESYFTGAKLYLDPDNMQEVLPSKFSARQVKIRPTIQDEANEDPCSIALATVMHNRGPIKVKQHVAGKSHDSSDTLNKEEIEIIVGSNHVSIDEGSDSDISEDEIQNAPPQLEDGVQATVDELKELNLCTTEEPRLIFVSALLSPEEENQYFKTLDEYRDVFAWTYKEMPGLDPKVAIHHLSIRHGVRPIKQSQRVLRPIKQSQRVLRPDLPRIETEVNKLIDVEFIKEVKYPTWISSIVPVKKKNGQMRIYVHFRDLNKACPKDDFSLPIIELMVDATIGHEASSLMDGSSGTTNQNVAQRRRMHEFLHP
ncbi:UNVERIFIED_CONTAM: hypothetical protein Slati_0420700 [Sesamum latifolium]|uniref:Retrotransposon gag domain-containing protein n=1 Tax=Sesamum latifolium TaxID=2727402 RepID=A0AAW2Y071_9LAMI